MYEPFFHFSRRPFCAAPDPGTYFPAASMEQARLTLTRCIERGTGPGLLIAPPGLGKTLLCQILAKQFADKFAVALLANAHVTTPRALLQAILFELGRPFRDMEEGELRLSLIDHVAPSKGGVKGMLLLVDEAHTLPMRLLEEIRMITNLVRDGELRARVVLSGNSALEESFASPKLVSFNQRIAARCYLETCNRDETFAYVRDQLSMAGTDPDSIFSEDALVAIHRASDGIPRLINQLADHALTLAAAGGQTRIGAAGIEEAWADLQQLPAPFAFKAEAASGSPEQSVVEFGSLSDSEDDMPQDSAVAVAVETYEVAEPTAQLDAIERQISEFEHELAPARQASETVESDQFEPADRMRPEVELTFHDAEDPFAEEFVEEEVVALRSVPLIPDRPGADAQSAADRPLADEVPGRSTGRTAVEQEVPRKAAASIGQPEPAPPARIENHDDVEGASPPVRPTPARPQLAVVSESAERSEAAEDGASTGGGDEKPAYDIHRLGIAEFDDDELPAETTANSSEPDDAASCDEAEHEAGFEAEPAAASASSPLWPLSPAELAPADDRDLLVVEDPVDEATADSLARRPNRHDYRRLFARLRQRQA